MIHKFMYISDNKTIPVQPTTATSSFRSLLDRGKNYLKHSTVDALNTNIINSGGTTIDSATQGRVYTGYPSLWAGDEANLQKDVEALSLTLNNEVVNTTPGETIRRNITSYNRFKLPYLTSQLTHTMSHVFFTRPNCNLFENDDLTETAKVHPTIASTYMRNPILLTGLAHDLPRRLRQTGNFNLLLSNASTSFQLSDEYIDTASSSKTLDGHQMAYGKLNTTSKASGTFTVNFDDDRNLSVYQQLKVWVDYISAVYIGELEPTYKTVINRELDYAANVYYILTAEDGYTILFWSKYYGVFPKTIPSSQYSWTKGNSLSTPSLNVEFQYSFKEDYILDTIQEFNTDSFYGMESSLNGLIYAPAFDKTLNRTGSTWVGMPFIDTYRSDADANNRGIDNLVFRLMFAPK